MFLIEEFGEALPGAIFFTFFSLFLNFFHFFLNFFFIYYPLFLTEGLFRALMFVG